MKKVIYALCLLTINVVTSWGQCATDPIQVNVIATQTDACTYDVLLGMNLPASPAQIQNFDITVLFGGATSGTPTQCFFPQSNVFCNATNQGISLFSTNTGSSENFSGFTLVEFETNGCLTFDPNSFFASDPCIVLGNVSGFCTTPPQTTGPACVKFNYLDDPTCETDVFTNITAISGCTEQTVGVPPGEGVCFDTYDNECVDIEMEADACGCEDETVVTTVDLVTIQRHILGLDPINSAIPESLVDVNCDGSITAIDLITMRRHILGLPTDVEGDCPNIGDCVMVDNETGEIVTEICPLDPVDVSIGVFGDADGSCDPCGNGPLNIQDGTNNGRFISVIKEDENNYLTFTEDFAFHSISLELPLDEEMEASQIQLSSKLNPDYFEKEIVNNKLHLLLFSQVPMYAAKGDILLAVESKNLNFIGALEPKNNLMLSTDGSMVVQDQLSVPKRDTGSPSFDYSINDRTLMLSHNMTGDQILVRIVNINGQVLLEKNLTNLNGFISVEIPTNENLIFVSMSSETAVVTKPILNFN